MWSKLRCLWSKGQLLSLTLKGTYGQNISKWALLRKPNKPFPAFFTPRSYGLRKPLIFEMSSLLSRQNLLRNIHVMLLFPRQAQWLRGISRRHLLGVRCPRPSTPNLGLMPSREQYLLSARFYCLRMGCAQTTRRICRDLPLRVPSHPALRSVDRKCL